MALKSGEKFFRGTAICKQNSMLPAKNYYITALIEIKIA